MPHRPLIVRHWREIAVGGVLLTLAAVCWYRGERIDTLEAKLAAEQSRYEQQVSDYRAAYQTAVANAHAAARFVEVQQERITHEVSADYQARLADVRARYQRLLAEAKADSRDAGTPDLPGVSDATCRVNAGPTYCGLSLEARLVATEQALQLDALQNWIRKQVAVER
ncbi:hypothetical protein [Sphingosinicella xenopeptidilytica]|uniref:Lysis protein n=1 Tax=Sphingosinicella xenopeptidilytica TaxID=364098 RepID=A0ABW3C1N7_SPHXN